MTNNTKKLNTQVGQKCGPMVLEVALNYIISYLRMIILKKHDAIAII